jgi:threonylcarbamoyladenosine tRNA methylthiotransferase MtaB
MPSFYIHQFGCRATQADGAAIERQLLDRGCLAASDASSADFVVLNTCTVTAAADSQARDAIRKIHSANPSARIIATGCYAQRAPEELAALPGVSWVVGNSHKPQIPGLVMEIATAPTVFATEERAVIPGEARNSSPSRGSRAANLLFLPVHSDSDLPLAPILAGNIFDHSEFLSAPVLGGESHHTRPTLKIQDGCNLRCSYCVIPLVRGKSRSLPADAVIREISRLAASGFREIVLSGINLGTYGRDLSPRVAFLDLLRRILDETSLERLRLSSIEPLDVSLDLIDLFASTDRLAEHFHMPLQSGSDRILAAMHRWYRTEHYARHVELIRERLPHAAIGADVIAGFPGETETDHAATLAFIERQPFTYLHVFSFSSRPGTQAAHLPHQVPVATIKRRARELRSLSESKSSAFRRSQIGRTLRVLTLHRSPHDDLAGFTPALSTNYLRVRVPVALPSNLWVETRIEHSEGNNLSGEIVEPSRQTLCESCAQSASLG